MDNNPLKQYFRRPAVYLDLPSGGKNYAPGVLEVTETGSLPVYPMTAIDEITSRTPDALFNGAAVVELIRSCIPAIKEPWSINSTDLDAVLISIKAASGGDKMEVETICPECEKQNTYDINLVGMLGTLKSGDYDTLKEAGDLKVKFRPLIYKEMNEAAMGQFEVSRTFQNIDQVPDEEREKIAQAALGKITDLTMNLLSQTIEYVQIPDGSKVTEKEFILDFLKNCDRATYIELRDHNTTLREKSELQPLNIKCSACEHEYTQSFTINPTDFFG